MRRAPKEEKVISVYTTNGVLLAHYEEGYIRICEEMPHLPNAGQPNSHPPKKFTKHGYPMALPYLRA